MRALIVIFTLTAISMYLLLDSLKDAKRGIDSYACSVHRLADECLEE